MTEKVKRDWAIEHLDTTYWEVMKASLSVRCTALRCQALLPPLHAVALKAPCMLAFSSYHSRSMKLSAQIQRRTSVNPMSHLNLLYKQWREDIWPLFPKSKWPSGDLLTHRERKSGGGVSEEGKTKTEGKETERSGMGFSKDLWCITELKKKQLLYKFCQEVAFTRRCSSYFNYGNKGNIHLKKLCVCFDRKWALHTFKPRSCFKHTNWHVKNNWGLKISSMAS